MITSYEETQEFCEALAQAETIKIDNIPVGSSEGKERDLDAARETAVWPDATDEELSVPRDELVEKLRARLPALMAEFKETVTSLGFEWSQTPRNEALIEGEANETPSPTA